MYKMLTHIRNNSNVYILLLFGYFLIIYFGIKYTNSEPFSGVLAKGKIKKIKKQRTREFLVIEFVDSFGNIHKFETNYMHKNVVLGDIVDVVYNPNNPQEAKMNVKSEVDIEKDGFVFLIVIGFVLAMFGTYGFLKYTIKGRIQPLKIYFNEKK